MCKTIEHPNRPDCIAEVLRDYWNDGFYNSRSTWFAERRYWADYFARTYANFDRAGFIEKCRGDIGYGNRTK